MTTCSGYISLLLLVTTLVLLLQAFPARSVVPSMQDHHRRGRHNALAEVSQMVDWQQDDHDAEEEGEDDNQGEKDYDSKYEEGKAEVYQKDTVTNESEEKGVTENVGLGLYNESFIRRRRGPPPDPFQSEAFLSAKTTKEQCEALRVVQSAFEEDENGLYSASYVQYEDFHHYDRYGASHSAKCVAADENARGVYHAEERACIFAFHRITETEHLSDHQYSTACSTSNEVQDGSFKDYFKDTIGTWPDECVGDHLRCYKVGRDERIYLKYFCHRNAKKKDIPEGTTHVSVDCREDKKASKSKRNEVDSPFYERQEKLQANTERFILILLAVVTLLCFLCIFVIQRCFWNPYLQVMMLQKTAKKDEEDETRAFVSRSGGKEDDSPETGHNNNTMFRRKKGNENAALLSRV